MSKLLKILLGLAALVLVVVAIAVGYVFSNLDTLVRDAMQSVGTRVVGAPVRVGAVEIELREGRARVAGLRIANPAGFPDGDALALDGIAVDLDVAATTSELVVIERVAVDGTTINAVQTPTGNNLKTLLDRLRAGDEDAQDPAADTAGTETRLVIDEFRFENAELNLAVPALGQQRSATVPDVVLRDIGRKAGGVTAAEAAREVLEPLVERALQSYAGLSREDLEQRARDEADRLRERGEDALRERLGGFLER